MVSMGELQQLNDDEVATRLREAKQELFNLRFQHVTGQLDNPARLGQVRRDIARIKTEIRARQLVGSAPDSTEESA